MNLRAKMARDARTVLTRLDHLGEEVVYLFKAGGQRTVRAVVRRLDLEPAESRVPQIARLRARLTIPRDDTVGITAYQPGDKIQLAMRLGETPVTARIVQKPVENAGVFIFEVVA